MRPHTDRPATAGSTPLALRGKASLRAVLNTAVAAAIGLVPAVMVATPAQAAAGDYTLTSTSPVNEGAPVVFTLTRTAGGVLGADEVLNITTIEGTAKANLDYTPVTTTRTALSANAASTQTFTTISVPTLTDNLDEDDESFTLQVTRASDGTPVAELTVGNRTGTITDINAGPTYTLTTAPASVSEGTATATITARLATAAQHTITIPVVTANGTATSGQDFGALTPSTVTFAPTEIEKTFTVAIVDDNIDEAASESFVVSGTADADVTGTASVTVNVLDNDDAPLVNTADTAAVAEGATISFPVTLSRPSDNTVTVKYDTANGPAGTANPAHGTATAGSDYTAVTSGTVTFAPGEQSKTATVVTLADNLDEISPEDLSITLSAPTNATLGTTVKATSGITDNVLTAAPTVTVTPSAVTEGDSGISARTFTATLSKPSGRSHTVTWSVSDGTAFSYEDYVYTNGGTLTFAPGEVTKTFTIDVIGDRIDEGTGETIEITLGSSTLSPGSSLGSHDYTITDDDALPVFSLTKDAITMKEGDSFAAALIPVKLSNPSSANVSYTITYTAPVGPGNNAAPVGASFGPGADDFELITTGTQTIPAGQTNGYAVVIVNGDEVFEPDEIARFSAQLLGGETDASGTPATAVLTLENDDKAPVLKVNNVSAVEGTDVKVTGTVTGVSQSDTLLNMSVAGASVDGSNAAEPEDFVNPGQFLVTIDRGTLSGSSVPVRTIKLNQDTINEAKETIVVSGTGLANAASEAPSVTSGVITIEDDDSATDPDEPTPVKPTISVEPFRLGVGDLDVTGKAAAGTTVELWAAPVGGGALTKVDETESDSDGDYSFTVTFEETGYRLQTKATNLTSDIKVVWLKHDPVMTSTSASKRAVTLRTFGDPKLAGLTVVIQRYVDGEWVKVGTGTTNAKGMYTRTFTNLPSRVGVTHRAYIVGDEDMGLAGGYSKYSRVIVK